MSASRAPSKEYVLFHLGIQTSILNKMISAISTRFAHSSINGTFDFSRNCKKKYSSKNGLRVTLALLLTRLGSWHEILGESLESPKSVPRRPHDHSGIRGHYKGSAREVQLRYTARDL